MSAIAFVILDVAFISSDFSYNIVASGSSTTTPFFYRAAAIWSTQQGSLLLWVMLLSFWSSLALFITRRRVREIVPYAQSVLFGLLDLLRRADRAVRQPVRHQLASPPGEGAGLDPLLRHTTMMIHPPMLYSGFTLLLVPFAFCIGALVSGRVGAEWIQVTRRFALAGWLCLGIGLLLGARWSYTELGWGGYWEWDPVENAALMPWLVCTAYIHSIMIQEKRGMLKVWNTSLVLLTGTLAIVGDFLVRSGILSSIHAFVSDPTLNIAFVVLIAAMVLGSVWLVTYRRDALSSEHRLDSLLSREGVFLLQNVVLVALAAVVVLAHVLPAHLRGDHRHADLGRAARVRPLRRPAGADRGRALRDRADHRVAPGDGCQAQAHLRLPGGGGAGHVRHPRLRPRGDPARLRLHHVRLRGVRGGHRGPGVLPRRPGAPRHDRRVPGPVRSWRWCAAIAGATAAIWCTPGWRWRWSGVAGSTSFQHQRFATLRPGQSVHLDGYTFKYVHPTAHATAQKVSFGARPGRHQGRAQGDDAAHHATACTRRRTRCTRSGASSTPPTARRPRAASVWTRARCATSGSSSRPTCGALQSLVSRATSRSPRR